LGNSQRNNGYDDPECKQGLMLQLHQTLFYFNENPDFSKRLNLNYPD